MVAITEINFYKDFSRWKNRSLMALKRVTNPCPIFIFLCPSVQEDDFSV